MKLLLSYFVVIILLLSCKNDKVHKVVLNDNTTTNHPSFVELIESAYRKDKLTSNESISFNLDVTINGKQTSQKIYSTPSSSTIRLEKSNGAITMIRNAEVFSNAIKSELEKEKSDLYSLQYFLMLPYRLSEQNTTWNNNPQIKLANALWNTALLTISNPNEDTTSEFRIYTDPHTNLIEYVEKLIIHSSPSQERGEGTIIHYKNYENIDGIPFSRAWDIYKIDPSTLEIGEQIGTAVIKNVIFMDILPETYDITDLTKI